MRQPLHVFGSSPWPFFTGVSSFYLTIGLTYWFQTKSFFLVLVSLFLLGVSMYQWSRDVVREGLFMGKHTKKVQISIKLGMVLFILSEIMFFFGFFWSYFHFSLTALFWPPINPPHYGSIPLLNTIILLWSGGLVTFAHFSLTKAGSLFLFEDSLLATVVLGLLFTSFQLFEYKTATFSIACGAFGSCFFVLTGFHGLHVLIGTSALFVSWCRRYQFSTAHHLGFELSAWYWHFVDVVWLALYLCIYWWGG